MPKIADFSDQEFELVRGLVAERYQDEVELLLADSELRLDPDSSEMASCPTLFWNHGDVNFVVFKVDDGRYRTQFFYTPRDQYGTGRYEYDDLVECVAGVLQVQADHEREKQGVKSGSTGADL